MKVQWLVYRPVLPLMILATVGLACLACDKKEGNGPSNGKVALTELYGVNAPFGQWEIEVRINGEPAFFDSGIPSRDDYGGGGLIDVTPFVVNGRNFVSMVARRTQASRDSSGCWTHFLRMTGEAADESRYSTLVGGIFQQEGKPFYTDGQYRGVAWEDTSGWPDEYSAEFELDAEVPLIWEWQSADEIDGLTEDDRASIIVELEKLAVAYRSRQSGSPKQLIANWFPGTQPPETPWYYPVDLEVIAGQEKAMMALSDYEVATADADQLVFRPGQRIVQLTVKNATHSIDGPLASDLGCLLYVGPALKRWEQEKEPGPWQGHLELFFFRKDGQWRMLSREWRY